MAQPQVVIVTGATSGVGRRIAAEFAARGAAVVGSGRRADLGEALERDVAERGQQFNFVQGDVRIVADCDRIVEAAHTRYGRVDVLVNNAGAVGDPPLVNSDVVTEAWWDQIFETNLKGAFFCSRAALVVMRAQRSGLILNVSSTNIAVPIARMQAYNVAKAALAHLSQSLAVEFQSTGIRVNTVVLGAVEGESGAQTARAIREHMSGSAELESSNLGRRIAISGRAMARAVVALASDDLTPLTGATIPIDRGVSAGLLSSLAMYQILGGLWTMPIDDP